MPFRSQAQRRFMYAEHPDIARRFEAETPAGARLPQHVGDAKQRIAQTLARRKAPGARSR